MASIAKMQQICEEVKWQAEQKGGKRYKYFQAKSYRTKVTQEPPGTLYFIKVMVDRDEYVHLRAREIPTYCLYVFHTGEILELEDIRTARSLEDPIEFF